MAVGNAVIARGTPTNSEVIAEAGLTYPEDDPIDGLTDALGRLARDDGLVQRLRTAAVQRIRDRYSWEHVTDMYEDLFNRLVPVPRAMRR